MLNLTITSFSISYAISCSPLFSGNFLKLQKIKFSNFYFPNIFIDPKHFQLKESFFNYGIGLFLKIENKLNPAITFIGKTFDNNNQSLIKMNIDKEHSKDLVMISNCIFKNVIYPKNSIPIKIDNTMITFYLDSCSFIDNDANSVIFDIKTRATTFSKICCTSLTRTKRSDNIPLFINAEILLGSFIKIIDTTIYGTNERTEASGLCQLSGGVSLLFNNLNISKIRTTGDTGMFRITNCVCSSIQMSTFKLLYADKDGSSFIIYLQPKGNTHKISFCNFIDNKYSGYLFRQDLQSAANVSIYKCVFANPDKIGNTNNFVYFNSDNSVLVFKECSFESNSIRGGSFQTDNCILRRS